ncbi:glycoside hydrolase family 78 protein [Parabacteroides sp. OttesenSCG-928-G07]|nr:glycoside hydrolase family 78 protein [Parabacteroides sp. OttesenSCG-928-G21]MDL2277337.1 glycoside hydrolase family 78 protein [Parabacteroides sp. OttesenSCG-928-G07]
MKVYLLILISFFSIYSAHTQSAGLCIPEYLSCDHLIDPIGIDNPNPRLSWRLNDARTGAKQTAYQLFVDTDSLAVVGGRGNVWNTQKVTSDKMLLTYAGEDLIPFTRYYWKISVWDKDGRETSSSVASFETGMMAIENWQGAWIADRNDIHYEPAPYFRKEFKAKKTIRSARAYIAVAGLYELYINGEKIGNHRLDPMYTRFDRRNLYVTYDVTAQLQNGENAVGVLLGNGWYNHQSMAVWDFHRAPWRNRPAFCLDLRITYTDGSVETVSTDQSWKTSSGALTFNSIYTAEHYDARLEQEGWNRVSFDDSKWGGVIYRSVPSGIVAAQQVHPIRNVEEFPAQSVKKLNDTTYLYDFGQNMSGVTRIKASGKAGTELRIKHGERLQANGHIDLANIDVYYRGDKEKDPFQTDILILSGKEDEFMARFNYKGFRYVEVTCSEPVDLNVLSLTAYFMHSDVPAVGGIKTSNPLIDKLWWATNNAYLSNLMGYPTDCPQREKNGWTGDGHFAIETGLYNFDGITIYEKWLADHRDEQQPNGVLPDIIPTGGWGYGTENGLDWTSTIAIIPWEVYQFYGDSKLLADCYENIKRYVNYVERTSTGYLTSWGRGDWVPVKSRSNKELTSSVYFYVDTKILAQAAKLFGRQADYVYYSALAEKIKSAVNTKYLNRATGIYADGTQTELSVPLQWGIVPDDMMQKVADNLAKRVEEAGFHLDVGVLGAKALLNALTKYGHVETAYKVAVQDKYPSWGWWIVNGATTLLENWDLDAPRDISDNHMMFGEIGGWFFKGLGGIYPDPEQPGFKNILLRPNFVDGLEEFEATHASPYGLIVSKWKRERRYVNYSVEVPPNSTAVLYLPANVKAAGERVMRLEAGRHTFRLEYNR